MQLAALKKVLLRFARSPFLWAFLLGIGSLHVVREFAYLRRSAPPPLVTVGPWSLTNHKGEAFGSKDLAGKVTIASFFFTRCPTICPKITRDMIEVRKRFAKLSGQVHFLSFSVDPEHDVPAVLTQYRDKYGIQSNDWDLLTGTKEQVFHVVVEQMKLHMGDREEAKNLETAEILYNVSHVAEIALFDQRGDLRGKFPTDMTSLAALERAAKFLIEKGPDA